MSTFTSKKGPRAKTGCLTCRARHKRCTEELPACSTCRRANLKCERPGPIMYQPQQQVSSRPELPFLPSGMASAQDSVPLVDVSDALLLRRFQQDIAGWMDLFDQQQRYQILLMREASRSELLRRAICALSARQLALQTHSQPWEQAASEHYGTALRLQSETVEADPMNSILLPAATLLASYELMLLPGHDYTQHFFGAKAILEAQFEYLRADPLWLAAYWVFLRHDVSVALSNDSPIQLQEQFLIQPEIHNCASEDVMGNYSLLLLAKSLRLVHQPTGTSLSRSDLEGLRSMSEHFNTVASQCFVTFSNEKGGSTCYAIPTAAVAMQQALAVEILIRRWSGSGLCEYNTSFADVQLGERIIEISCGYLPDCVQTQSVHYLCFVGRKIPEAPSKDRAVGIMRELEERSGFHTSSRIAAMEK